MSTAFADLKPFPTATGPAQTGLGHNRPPLDEQVLIDFEDALREGGITQKVKDIVEAVDRFGECDSDDKAGRGGDFVKQCSATIKAIEAERETLNRPILTAQRALKGKGDGYVDLVKAASNQVLKKINAYMDEQRRIADLKRKAAEEAARKAQEAALAAAVAAGEKSPPPEIKIEPAKVDEPVVRGDYGARIGSTTVWLHEIESVRKLPDGILTHAKVMEAINSVIGQMVRGGTREIKGVRIWSEQKTAIR